MKEENNLHLKKIFISIIISILVYFSLGVKFPNSLLSNLIISIISLISLIYFSRRTGSEFYLYLLSSITLFIGLTTAFASTIEGNGLINIFLKLTIWPIFILTLFITFLLMFIYNKMKNPEKYSIILFIVFIIYWVLIAINAKYLDGWMSENYLAILFIIAIYFIHKWFKFSKLSYSLIFVFMILHVMGSHYTYSEVPLGYWMQDFFNLDRNHFDRIVHFCFG